MTEGKKRYTQITCPKCGEAFKVRILELEGRLRYSVHCKKCKTDSIVELENIQGR